MQGLALKESVRAKLALEANTRRVVVEGLQAEAAPMPLQETEEVVEPEEEEAEEEEEEGLEVEQVTIRGRTYWLDSNTKKLYANLEGDEVGDEVGAMVNGKPLFLAA